MFPESVAECYRCAHSGLAQVSMPTHVAQSIDAPPTRSARGPVNVCTISHCGVASAAQPVMWMLPKRTETMIPLGHSASVACD